MTSPWQHLQKLLAFGPRPIGSPANQAAADSIREIFASLDLDVEEQPYACTAWEHTGTQLEINGAGFTAEANAFSPACDVEARIVSACTVRELESIKAAGMLLLLYGDLTGSPLAPKSWFLKSDRDNHIIQQLEKIHPAAILALPTETEYVGQLIEDWEFDLPSATIPMEVALVLIQHPESSAHLTIRSKRMPAKARNIVARTRGSGGERLVLCAHFDTKKDTPGASDNAGGVAAMLALAEILSDLDLPVGLEFVAFNGEEYLPMGDEEYLRRAESYFDAIAACINFDGIGTALGATSITAMAISAAIETKLKSLIEKYRGVVWVEPWPESNHTTFAMRGVPAIAFSAVGMRRLAHAREDTLEVMHPEKLTEVTALTREIVALLCEHKGSLSA